MSHSAEHLTPRQTRAIAELLSAKTLEDAARATGVSRSTLRRWLHEPTFMHAYEAARQELVDFAVGQIQSLTGLAAATFRQVMEDSEGSATARITAAKSVMEIARGLEHPDDLEDRLSAIEDQLREISS